MIEFETVGYGYKSERGYIKEYNRRRKMFEKLVVTKDLISVKESDGEFYKNYTFKYADGSVFKCSGELLNDTVFKIGNYNKVKGFL